MCFVGYCKEPGPKLDQQSLFESMMELFQFTAELLGLKDAIFQYLASPGKRIIVSIPALIDAEEIEVFEGYRSIPHHVRVPSIGDIHYVPDVTIDEVKTLAAG